MNLIRRLPFLSQYFDSNPPWFASIILLTIAVALISILIGLIVAIKVILWNTLPIQQPASMIALGAFLVLCAHAMHERAVWARNVAVVTTSALIYIIGVALAQRIGVPSKAIAGIPAIAYLSICLTYFTGSDGRALFAPPRSEIEAKE